jgi:O-antigen/teichoic acid export membrane protein
MSATGTDNDGLDAAAESAGDLARTSAGTDVGRTPLVRARQLVTAAAGLSAVTVWTAALGLVTTPYLIRHLGASRYGVFALITIVTGYLANLEFGFGHAMGRFLSRARAAGRGDDEEAVLNTSLAVFLAAATIGGLAVLVGSPFIDQRFVHGALPVRQEALGAIRLGGVLLVLTFLSTFAATGLGALGKFKTFVVTRGVFGTLLSAGAIVTVAMGGGLRAVVTVQVVLGAVQCAILFGRLARATPVRLRPSIHAQTFRAMASFGVMVLIAGLASQALMQGPPTVLAARASTRDVAAFAVPAVIMQQLASIASSASLGFLTFASGESTAPDRTHLAAVFQSNLRMTILVAGLPVAYLAVFAHVLLGSWISASFAASASGALRWLAVGALALAISGAPADVSRAFGRPGFVTLYTIVGALLAIGTSLALVGAYGASGVAAALCLTLVVITIPFIGLVSRGLLDTRPRTLAAALWPPLALIACASALFVVANAIVTGLAAALATGVLVTILYAAVVLTRVATDREREVLMSVVRRRAHA